MAVDYSKRRQVPVNRPKSRGGSLIVLAMLGGIALVFATGFVFGWFSGKNSQKKAYALQLKLEAARNAEVRAAAAPPVASGKAENSPPLTFYNTLKGGKDVIGTGINSPKPVEKGSETYPSSPGTAAVPVQTVPGASQPESVKPAQSKREEPKGKFTVQIASYRDRKEADVARDKLMATGVPAFVIESHVKDHGVWYRLRAGKGLEQKDAAALQAKLGKSALLVPE